MTLEKPVSDEERARLISELEKRVALARAKAKIYTAVSVGLVALVILALVTYGFINTVQRNRDSNAAAARDAANAVLIESLIQSLDEAKAALAEVTASEQESSTCKQRYDTAVSENLSDFLSSLGDLALAGFSTPPAPAPDRATAVATAATELAASSTAWQAAIDARSAWQESGSPLPCPLTST